jgi:hypothetical protein
LVKIKRTQKDLHVDWLLEKGDKYVWKKFNVSFDKVSKIDL